MILQCAVFFPVEIMKKWREICLINYRDPSRRTLRVLSHEIAFNTPSRIIKYCEPDVRDHRFLATLQYISCNRNNNFAILDCERTWSRQLKARRLRLKLRTRMQDTRSMLHFGSQRWKSRWFNFSTLYFTAFRNPFTPKSIQYWVAFCPKDSTECRVSNVILLNYSCLSLYSFCCHLGELERNLIETYRESVIDYFFPTTSQLNLYW